MGFLEHPLGKLVTAVVLLVAIAPIVMWFFRDTWAALDADAARTRQEQAATGRPDYRAPLALVLCAFSLTLIHYYADHDTFIDLVRPALQRWQNSGATFIDVGQYEDLYWRVFFSLSRVVAYLLPLALWRLFYKDNLLDFGLRGRGFVDHLWIYVLCIVVIVPTLVAAAGVGDFAKYYPMYKTAWRSWLDLWIWEAFYILQFFVLEVFFRGFWLRGARSLGAGAIFSMVPAYVMIHFPKPFLESCGAAVAGVVLGSLSMKTRSIYAGFLVHATVAILMDLLALQRRGALPTRLTPTSEVRLVFPYLNVAIWGIWLLALGYLAFVLWRRRAAAAPRRKA